MKPGIYPDISFEDYLAIPAMNWSTLCYGLTSMKRLKAAVDGRLVVKKTRAMEFGRAIHSAVLEPDVFAKKYKFASPCEAVIVDKKAKTKRACGNRAKYCREGITWLCGMHCKDESYLVENIVSETELTQIEGIKKSLANHNAVKFFSAQGGCEMTAVFKYKDVLCKARYDKYIEGMMFDSELFRGEHNIIVDIKKVAAGRIDHESCSKSITDYDYFCPAALYKIGGEILSDGVPHIFVWVFIEDGEPFDCNVKFMPEFEFESGEYQVNRLLTGWKSCVDSGRYPVVSESITAGKMKPWQHKEYEGIFEGAL